MQTFAGPGSTVTGTMADRELHHQPRGVTRRLVAQALTTGVLAGRLSHPLTTDPAEPLFAYVRTDDGGESPVVVLLNFSESDQAATVDVPEAIAESIGPEALTDLWSGQSVSAFANGKLTVSIPGWGFQFLVPSDD